MRGVEHEAAFHTGDLVDRGDSPYNWKIFEDITRELRAKRK